MVTFDKQKFSVLMKSNLSIFSFGLSAFCTRLEKIFPVQDHEIIRLGSFQKFCYFTFHIEIYNPPDSTFISGVR